MTVRSLYSTGGFMNDGIAQWGAMPNPSGCAVALGAGSDGRYTINVIGFDADGNRGGTAYALMSREELRRIHEAIGRELLS